ncbi:MAG: hypothetical protein JW996_05530 [Candidatus Cloacimonetes bacterium]|nr:hypothetical protein [Candidatus Cloacimonadota bacterium]
MSKSRIGLMLMVIIPLLFCSCLTTEYKEYRFKINRDGSGEGSVKFVNIMSEKEEGEESVVFSDFGELIDNYLNGQTFEEENPNYQVTGKKLFEENGVLVGEVKFNFSSLESIGFYQAENCDCAPLMYYMDGFSETFKETNGNYLGGDTVFPFIIWDNDITEVYIKTIVTEDISNGLSLLATYKTWEEQQK